MFAEQFPVPAGENVGCGRRGSDDVFQAIDAAAFHVHAQKCGMLNSGLGVAQKLPCLLGADDVALEENDPAGLERGKRRAKSCRALGTFKAHEEKLADLETE